MKVSHLSRAKLIKKAEKRAESRIKEYTKVSSAFDAQEAADVKGNMDSAARYAYRHNVNLEFSPSMDEHYQRNGIKVAVYKRGQRLMGMHELNGTYDSTDVICIPTQDFAGSAIITEKAKSEEPSFKHPFLKSMREKIRGILGRK